MENEKKNSWNEKWLRQLTVAEEELLQKIESAERKKTEFIKALNEAEAQYVLVKLIRSQIDPPE